ncbi:TPA: MFS transporter [Yersinia enterocolitica]
MSKPLNRCFIVSTGLDNFGDGLMTIFFPLIMLSMTSDPIIFSLSYVAKTLSSVLSSFISGYTLDFYPILKITRTAKVIRIISLILIISLPINITLIVFYAIVFGATEVFTDNAAQTICLSIYPRSELININNRLQSMEYFFVFFAGPLLGSFIFNPNNSSLLFLAIITYSLSLMSFLFMKEIPNKNKVKKKVDFRETMYGLFFLCNHISLRMLCFYAAAFCMIISSLFSVLPMIISSQTHNSQLYTGLFYALNSLGFVLASSLTPKVAKFLSIKKILSLSLLFSLASSIVIVVNNSIYYILISVFLLGCGMGCWGCIAVTYRQRVIPRNIFSRVNAVYRLFSWGALCLGGIMGGVIYQLKGYDILFYVTLIFTFILTFSFYFIPIEEEL